MTASSQYREVVIARRFNGPPGSGNGGYCAGTLAAALPGELAEVTLRRPPPLEVPMLLSTGPGRARLMHDGVLVAEAAAYADELEPVDPVPPADAADAMTRYSGLRHHPFPTCFVCGPDRAEGDGLRIFPGRIEGDRTASAWTPAPGLGAGGLDEAAGEVPASVAWAALDCVSGWATALEERPSVLGRMVARIDALPRVGEPHVVVGRLLGTEGRKSFTASTLYDEDGRIVAQAQQVWVAVDPALFGA